MTYLDLDLSYGKNPHVISTVNTSGQTTSNLANTYVTINGSTISYTPDSSASKVVYEISFYAEIRSKYGFQHIILEWNNSVWEQPDVKFGKNFGFGNSSGIFNDLLFLRYIIPSWSGSRDLRLRSAGEANNRDVTYHQVTSWDGSGSITNRFCNTNLLVYSI